MAVRPGVDCERRGGPLRGLSSDDQRAHRERQLGRLVAWAGPEQGAYSAAEEPGRDRLEGDREDQGPDYGARVSEVEVQPCREGLHYGPVQDCRAKGPGRGSEKQRHHQQDS